LPALFCVGASGYDCRSPASAGLGEVTLLTPPFWHRHTSSRTHASPLGLARCLQRATQAVAQAVPPMPSVRPKGSDPAHLRILGPVAPQRVSGSADLKESHLCVSKRLLAHTPPLPFGRRCQVRPTTSPTPPLITFNTTTPHNQLDTLRVHRPRHTPVLRQAKPP